MAECESIKEKPRPTTDRLESNVRIVALYKTWDGGEFVDASLASIYEHVDAIVMIHSEVSWLGERGNTVRRPAMEWCEKFDRTGKVHHVDVELASQEAQYAAGLDFIGDAFDVVMVVDADEIWEGQYIENARRFIHDHPAAAYRSAMQTYLKTPFYQVDPPFGSPITFLRDSRYLVTSPRGCAAPALHMHDVWMHHYTYVREARADVERKIRQSALADKSGEVVVHRWMEDVYDRMPEGESLHAFARHRSKWQRIRKVWLPDMPPAMRASRSLRLWVPDSIGKTLLEGEINAIQRLAAGRTQAVDLGTYHGLSAVALSIPCKRVHTVDCYGDLPHDSFADTLMPDRYAAMQDHSIAAAQTLAARFGNIACESARTDEAAATWNGGPVDILFVDADHSEAGVTRDVESWMPHLRTGSRIIFHDDNDIHPGVHAAIMKFKEDDRLRFIDPGEWSGSLAACEVQ